MLEWGNMNKNELKMLFKNTDGAWESIEKLTKGDYMTENKKNIEKYMEQFGKDDLQPQYPWDFKPGLVAPLPKPKKKKRPQTATKASDELFTGSPPFEYRDNPMLSLKPMHKNDVVYTSNGITPMEFPSTKDNTLWEAGKEMARVNFIDYNRLCKTIIESENISAGNIKEWIKENIANPQAGFTVEDDRNGEQVGEDIFPITSGTYTIRLIEEEKNGSGSNKSTKNR